MESQSDIDPPSFETGSQGYRRITATTFCSLFDNHPNFEKLVVIDGRSQLEYDGGHIKGAIRCHPFEDPVDTLYSEVYDPKTLFIFHCEYSAVRGPATLDQFYQLHQNAGRDPKTLHGFVLDGGYREFWQHHKEYCVGGYVCEADWDIWPWPGFEKYNRRI
jgi:M-phase inducer tyrosine phosphatase